MATSSIPILKECCCGCSLKTGSMIIGFITLVLASVLTFIAASALVHHDYVILVQDSSLDTIMEVALLVVRALQAAFSLLLIIATHREQAVMILPWLVISLIAILLEGTSLGIMLSHLAVGEINSRIFSMATHVSVTGYFIFVVFSYFREIRNKSLMTTMKV
ncbi:uncharacterized protein LOC124358748 isoform X1 [Homalodisca vitripennis]|uniref:uncharacterized protein LOC124358748 isoform X1 n=1 Tax=Homalodisca vitripennis TaxID=197043 RepID=UPI001EEAB9ED|nr:uncharacterized protein LOC124358748 isoform X1 [Homalodisca vitripennis]